MQWGNPSEEQFNSFRELNKCLTNPSILGLAKKGLLHGGQRRHKIFSGGGYVTIKGEKRLTAGKGQYGRQDYPRICDAMGDHRLLAKYINIMGRNIFYH